jgi:hypothetical protein
LAQGIDLGWPLAGEQHPDAVNLPRRLGLGGERRGEYADRTSDEHSPVHH